jgi:hypothetical protein
MGDGSELAEPLCKLIQATKPDARGVLELGCGTGSCRTSPVLTTKLLLQVRFPVFSETFSGGLHGITGVVAVLLASVAIGNGLSLVIDYLHGGAVKSTRIIAAAVDGARDALKDRTVVSLQSERNRVASVCGVRSDDDGHAFRHECGGEVGRKGILLVKVDGGFTGGRRLSEGQGGPEDDQRKRVTQRHSPLDSLRVWDGSVRE